MTAKDYLLQVKEIRHRVKILEEQVQQLRADAESVGISLDGMPHAQGGKKSKWEAIVIQLADCEGKLMAEMSELWSRTMKANVYIGRIQSTQYQDILIRRYLKDQRWEQISYEMHISWQHSFRIHGHALTELEKILHDEGICD